MISLQRLDEIAHDPLQTHLSSFLGDRGPYPGHPADERQKRRKEGDSSDPTPRVNGSSPPLQTDQSAERGEVAL